MRVHPIVAENDYQALIEIVADTRNFPGCLAADLLVERDDTQRVVLVVRWEDDDSYAAYRAWRAGDGAAVELPELLAEPSRLRWLAPI